MHKKSNRWSLSLSVLHLAPQVRSTNRDPSSTALLISVNGVPWRNFSKSTVVHAQNWSREPNHAPFGGDLSSVWQYLIQSHYVQNLTAVASAFPEIWMGSPKWAKIQSEVALIFRCPISINSLQHEGYLCMCKKNSFIHASVSIHYRRTVTDRRRHSMASRG